MSFLLPLSSMERGSGGEVAVFPLPAIQQGEASPRRDTRPWTSICSSHSPLYHKRWGCYRPYMSMRDVKGEVAVNPCKGWRLCSRMCNPAPLAGWNVRRGPTTDVGWRVVVSASRVLRPQSLPQAHQKKGGRVVAHTPPFWLKGGTTICGAGRAPHRPTGADPPRRDPPG